ncbi:ADP,ATP carrier protein 1 [Musa troglodytarum]|uniref:ADP,ATP carrier protein n=1 Tax=Musa troglodytarum TaxID=320322 RepID=A0A9E7GQM6_9LILI|nr:ADP,ATP carrier protein 1 [Musa troglodytarum]
MERVIVTEGLRPPLSSAQARLFHPVHAIRSRLSAAACLPSLGLGARSPTSSFYSFSSENKKPSFPGWGTADEHERRLLHPRLCRKQRKAPFFRAGAAISAGGDGVIDNKEKPKFLGVELVTLKKIIPLGMMFFCILFNYTILRGTKDVLVVAANGSGAEIIPFLKTWVNLPRAVGFMLLDTKLVNVLSKEALFYTVIVPFIAFFGAFGFVLYPLSSVIHPTALADKLLAALGLSFLDTVAILRSWGFCLFHVMAEFWGSVVIWVLFRAFANQDLHPQRMQLIYLMIACTTLWLTSPKAL